MGGRPFAQTFLHICNDRGDLVIVGALADCSRVEREALNCSPMCKPEGFIHPCRKALNPFSKWSCSMRNSTPSTFGQSCNTKGSLRCVGRLPSAFPSPSSGSLFAFPSKIFIPFLFHDERTWASMELMERATPFYKATQRGAIACSQGSNFDQYLFYLFMPL